MSEGDGCEAGLVGIEAECGDILISFCKNGGRRKEEAAFDAGGSAGLFDKGGSGGDGGADWFTRAGAGFP